MDLSSLLCPFDTDVFQHEYWEKRPLHVSRNNAAYFYNLFKLEDVAHVVELAQVVDDWMGDILVFKNLVQLHCPLNRLYDAYLDGASIIVNHVDKLWLPLNKLCQNLGRTFHHVFANMYFTPPNSQAVPAHSDDRDVILLQLAGEKNWSIYRAPIPLPFTEEMLGKDGRHISSRVMGDPLYEYTLRPGDVMYIPRGNVHEARTANECSLHVTLAIPTSDFTYAGLLEDAIRRFTREESQNMAFRHSIPIGQMDDAKTAEGEKLVATLVDSIASSVNFHSMMDLFRERMSHHRIIQARVVQNLPPVCVVKPHDLYRKQLGILMEVQVLRNDEGIMVSFYHEGNRLRKRFGEHLLAGMKFIAQSKRPFSVADIPAGDDFERIAIVRTLESVDVLESVDAILRQR